MKKTSLILSAAFTAMLCGASFAEEAAMAEEVNQVASLLFTFLPLILIFVIPGIVFLIVFSCIRRSKRKKAEAAQERPEPGNPVPKAKQPVSTNRSTFSAEELERLSRLHQDGSLTDEEFEAAKRKVLNGN